MGDNRKRVRYFSTDECYKVKDYHKFSLFLFLLVGIVWLLRRVSLFEILKRIFLGERRMAAWHLDVYLLLIWGITTFVGLVLDVDNSKPFWLAWIYLFIILQIVQTNVYHELWRPVLLKEKNAPLAVTYSRLRNLFIGFCNFVYVQCLFGLVYWKSSTSFLNSEGNTEFPFETPLDAIFFSFTVAWSVGSESIPSAAVDRFVEWTVVAQIITTLFLVSIILATSASSILTTGENKDEAKEVVS